MSSSMAKQYGEDGFIPTVENVTMEGDNLVMETIDGSPLTDLVGKPGEELTQRHNLLTDEEVRAMA